MATPATAPQPQSEAGLKERFFRYFQHEVTALQVQMERLTSTSYSGGERNDAVDHCLAGIDRLSLEVKDASGYIPAYDQRTYGEAIKALSEKLQNIRNTFNPPKKFQFKTARKNPSAISLSDAAELAQHKQLRILGNNSDTSNVNSSFAPTPLDKLSPTEEKRELELRKQTGPADDSDDNIVDGEGSTVRQPSFSSASSMTISKHVRSHIVLPSTTSHAAKAGTVSNLRHCAVDLSPPTANGGSFAGLTLKNIKESLVVCGQVTGSTHVTDIERSVIVASCRQFRMHGSKNVDVYLHCSSRPIIEDCDGIRFAPLPEAYETPDTSSTPNQWDQIDDFKWLKSEPSPNYSILPEAERTKDAVWKETVPGGHSVSLDNILEAVAVL